MITGNFHIDLGSATGARVVSKAVYINGGVLLVAGEWDSDVPDAYTASGDYSLIYYSYQGGTVGSASSISMVLEITFEPDGTTQTVNIPIDKAETSHTYATVTRKAGKYGVYGTYTYNVSVFCEVDPGEASQYEIRIDHVTDTMGHQHSGGTPVSYSDNRTVRLDWNVSEEFDIGLRSATVTLVSYSGSEVVEQNTYTVDLVSSTDPTAPPW